MSKKEQRRAEVMALLVNGSILQREAAERLGEDSRHIRRLLRAYKEQGAKGLISNKRGRSSNNKLNSLLSARIIDRIWERYPDFGPTLAHEKLKLEGFEISLSSIRRLMIQHGIWSPKQSKKFKVHQRRERRPRFGELIQIDGSHHAWFEGRAPKCCLIVFVDDATGVLVGLGFAESESMAAYFTVMDSYLRKYGRPEALYSDKHGIFRVNSGAEMETAITQFGRSMGELDIRSICAHSPQAKGRVERVNGILQDRLVKELRLQDISSIDEANTFLPKFIKDYNQRFAVAPQNPVDAHRVLGRDHDLELTLSIHDTRKVSKTLSFQFENTHYQILEEGFRARILIGSKVQVITTLKGDVRVFKGSRELVFTRADLIRTRPKSLDSKELNPEFEKWLKKKEPYRPPENSPFKQDYY